MNFNTVVLAILLILYYNSFINLNVDICFCHKDKTDPRRREEK